MATDNSTKTKKKIFLFGKRAIESLPTPETGFIQARDLRGTLAS